MHEVLDALVAINAIQFGVDGIVKRVGGKEQGNDIGAGSARGGGIEMAIEAIGVGKLCGRPRRGRGDPEKQQQSLQYDNPELNFPIHTHSLRARSANLQPAPFACRPFELTTRPYDNLCTTDPPGLPGV